MVIQRLISKYWNGNLNFFAKRSVEKVFKYVVDF